MYYFEIVRMELPGVYFELIHHHIVQIDWTEISSSFYGIIETSSKRLLIDNCKQKNFCAGYTKSHWPNIASNPVFCSTLYLRDVNTVQRLQSLRQTVLSCMRDAKKFTAPGAPRLCG